MGQAGGVIKVLRLRCFMMFTISALFLDLKQRFKYRIILPGLFTLIVPGNQITFPTKVTHLALETHTLFHRLRLEAVIRSSEKICSQEMKV